VLEEMTPSLLPTGRAGRELPHLEEAEADGERDDVHVTEGAGDAREDQALPHEDGEHDGEHDRGGVEQEGGVYEHPDGDEEEHREHVAQGAYVRQGLVAVVRLGEDDAGDKGAEGEGEAEDVGPVADAEAGCHDGDQEQLPRVEPGDAPHKPGKDPRPEEGHGADKQRGLERRDPERREPLGHVPELGQEDEQGHHREVLHDEHPDDDPAG
jgi:hypothetical protein